MKDMDKDGGDDDGQRADKKRKKYASSSGGSETEMKNLSSSTEDQNKLCCTSLAMTVYTKAWEGAKRAIPHKYVLYTYLIRIKKNFIPKFIFTFSVSIFVFRFNC